MTRPSGDQERDRRRTLLVVILASIMERADEALLPAVYREIGAAMHADPTWLGSLTLCRSIVQAACYPLTAYAAAGHNRARVIAVGAFLWAAATFLVSVSQTFAQVAISRGLNGIGLALVVPSIQSLADDSTDDGTRGSAFGWLQLASCIGLIAGGFVGLLLAQTTVLGIAGWRIAFHLVAVISVAVGALNWFFSVDPISPRATRPPATVQQVATSPACGGWWRRWSRKPSSWCRLLNISHACVCASSQAAARGRVDGLGEGEGYKAGPRPGC